MSRSGVRVPYLAPVKLAGVDQWLDQQIVILWVAGSSPVSCPSLKLERTKTVSVIDALLDLQDVDGRVMEFEKELKHLPARKAHEMAGLNGASAEVKAAEAVLEQYEDRIKAYEAEAEELRKKKDELKRAQLSLKTNKEYQQFSIQIDQIDHEIDTLENNILATTDRLPSANEAIAKAKAEYDAQKSVVDAHVAEFDERIAYVESELAVAKAERGEKEKLVSDPSFLLAYERLRTRRWPVVSPLTDEGVCDGCNLQQPPSVAQLVKINAKNAAEGKPMRVVACNVCGRILYA